MAVKQFTLRIAPQVYIQIENRAKLMGRSVNKEIETLLAWAIDHQIEADEKTFKKMQDHLAGIRDTKSGTANELGLPSRT